MLPWPACLQTVRFLADTLKQEGYKAVMLHGERSQPEREEAMTTFKAGKAQVCADSAGRLHSCTASARCHCAVVIGARGCAGSALCVRRADAGAAVALPGVPG
jgi:superfamily II DNA/RNA helicase